MMSEPEPITRRLRISPSSRPAPVPSADHEEEEARALLEEAGRARALVQALARTSRGVVLVLDREGTVLEVFAQSDELLPEPMADMEGLTLNQLMGQPQADELVAVIRRAIESGRTQHKRYRAQVTAGLREFEAQVSPLAGSAAVPMVAWVARDVTLDHEREQPMRTVITRPEESMDLGGTMAALAHVLRTALGPNVQLAMRHVGAPCHVCMDRATLEQAVADLARNARESMPPGSTFTVETGAVPVPGTYAAPAAQANAVIRVSGTGVGTLFAMVLPTAQPTNP